MTDVRYFAAVAVGAAALFAGGAFVGLGNSTAQSGGETARLLKELAREADKTNSNLYAICKNQESTIYQHYCKR